MLLNLKFFDTQANENSIACGILLDKDKGMAELTINVPDELIDTLVEKAYEYGRSVDEDVQYLLLQALKMRKHVGTCEIDLFDALLISRLKSSAKKASVNMKNDKDMSESK